MKQNYTNSTITLIRPARMADLASVATIIRRATEKLDEQGIHQWDDSYPDMQTLRTDIEERHMYVLELDHKVCGLVVVNEWKAEEYDTVAWAFPGRQAIVHRLAIDPECQGKGLGSLLMDFVERDCAARMYDVVRLDAFSENRHSLAMYEARGYRRAGSVRFDMGLFYLYEKAITGLRDTGSLAGTDTAGRLSNTKLAIRKQHPSYLPLLFFNRDREQSDIIVIDVVQHYGGPERDRSEWGFSWERMDETMGQPKAAILDSYSELASLAVPDPDHPERFSAVKSAVDEFGPDRYYLASMVLTGFTVMSALRGFASLLMDFYTDPKGCNDLADIVFGFEEAVIRNVPRYGFHGVAFFDDWGTQSGLLISPSLWREFFKPRYRRQFALCHDLGLDVYFHCCGQIEEIIPDLIEIGVDMLNLSQPNIFNIEKLGRSFASSVCFVCPVSYQTTSITGSREQIFADVGTLIDNLATKGGGLIGYVEEYHSIGMSEENYRACIDAFRTLGDYSSSSSSR